MSNNGNNAGLPEDPAGKTSTDDDGILLQKAARMLDAQTDTIDMPTRAALARARANAAEARRRQWLSLPWLAWGSAGVGVAMAASLAVLVILPDGGKSGTADAAIAGLLATPDDVLNDIALVDDADAALAEDLAFVAWLEENDAMR